MIRWIVGATLRLRFLILIIALVLIIFGIVQLRQMPIDVYPEFDPPLVEVQTEALGLSAVEIEALLTVPLEADLLNGVAWLDEIYSESVAGLSSILLVFEPGTDPIRARLMVQERLTQTFALPNVSQPPTMLQPLSASSRAMMVGLSSDELSLLDLGVLARWNIKPRLMGVPGVANVAIWGHRDRQLQVLVDPEQLNAKDVTLQQVIETTGEALWVSPLSYLESSSPGTAGWIDTPNQRLSIRHELPIVSAEDLSRITLVDGGGLTLKDVATVVEDHQPLIGDAALDDGPGLMLVIEKLPGANTLEVTRAVEEALAELAPGLRGVDIDSTIFRPANYIEVTTNNISSTLIIGAILMVVVISLFFFNWRTALITILVIPMSLIASGYVLFLRGETFNTMILAGLIVALGVIIDNTIVDVHNIARRLRHNQQSERQRPLMSVVHEAVLEMRDPLTFALLINLLVVVPIFFIPGLTGAFFAPFVTSYILALLVSFLVTIIVTPALSMILLADVPLQKRQLPFVKRIQDFLSEIVEGTLNKPNFALIFAAVVIVVGLATLPFFRTSILPNFKQTELLIEFEAAPGTSRTQMNRIVGQTAQEIRAIPGVKNVGSQIGRAITGDAVVGINSGELWVSIDPDSNYDATLTSIQEIVNGYPGLFRTVQTYAPERTAEALIGPDQDLVVRIFGHDLQVLDSKADDVMQSLAGIDGIVDVQADRHVEEPQLEIEVNLAAAERFQIKPGDVRRQATTLLSGLRVGNLYEENKVFDVVVWGTPEIRESLTDIRALLIDTPNGQVQLGDLADVRIAPTPIIIKRNVVSRYIDVNVHVEGRRLTAVSEDIKASLGSVSFPLEYHAEVLGISAGQQDFRQRMIYIVIATVIGAFLLLQATYRSWSLAFVTLLTLPMALTGSALGVILDGGVLSIGSLFGFLTIMAISIRTTIILINHFQNLELYEGETFGTELIMRGVRERMEPILLTTLATGLTLLPFLFNGRRIGFALVHPMAVVIIGGLITSMLLNIFVMPSLYLRFGSSPELETVESAVVPAFGAGTD